MSYVEDVGVIRDWILGVRDADGCVTCLSPHRPEMQHCGNEEKWGRVKYGEHDDIRYVVRQCHTCHQLTDRFDRLAALHHFQGLIVAFNMPDMYSREREERISDTHAKLNAMQTMKNITWKYALRGYRDAPQEVLEAVARVQGPNPTGSKWDYAAREA